MKQKIAVFILVGISFLCFSFPTSAASVLDDIVKRKALRVGTSGQQPPMTAIDKTGEIIGLDIDLAKAMAAAMNVKIEFVVMPFHELLPALQAGRVDMVISGLTITPQRNLKFAFAGPYYASGKGILATVQKYAALKEAKGLNSPEVRIAALMNSTSQAYAQELMPKAELLLTPSYDEALQLLFNEKVDVLVADYPFCALSAYRYQDRNLLAGESPLTFEPLGIALPEDTLLINWVKNFLLVINGSGELKRLQAKWLRGGKWVDQLR